MKNIKIVAFPSVCVDVFDGTDIVRPGGEELNFSSHAAEIEGVSVILLGAISDDYYGQCIKKAVEQTKIDFSRIRTERDLPTATCKTYMTPEKDRYYKEDSWNGAIIDRFRINDSEMQLLAEADVVYTHIRSKCFEQTVELKKKLGFKLAVDFEIRRDFDKMEEYAPYIEYFMISGTEELLPYFETFSRKYDGLFNMTLGEHGSVTYSHGKCYRVSACKVDEIVDTTGCGDSYHAGFICEHMMHKDILRAMNRGSEMAAANLSHYGGFIR